MRPIKIATRASKLALIQTDQIRQLIEDSCPRIQVSTVMVSTKGDRDKSDFLYKSESIGIFTSEVENAILDGRADIAVHSLKDLPTAANPALVIAAVPKREAVADVLVTSTPALSIEELPLGMNIGTSSLRRIAQVRHIRDDLNCVPLRGNVETRVKKVFSGIIGAAIIAQAGLNRLGLADKISAVLDPEKFLPAPAQGALAVQIRADDCELAGLLSKLDDKNSRITAEAERRVLSTLRGGCSIPLGVYSVIKDGLITIHAILSDIDGAKIIRRSITGSIDQSNHCAETLAEQLLSDGGRKILAAIRSNKD